MATSGDNDDDYYYEEENEVVRHINPLIMLMMVGLGAGLNHWVLEVPCLEEPY